MTTYHDQGTIACGGSVVFDDTLHGIENFFDYADRYFMFFLIDHGESVVFNFHVRIHQPTAGFNNNTEAIYTIPFYGTFLSGTASGDFGDYNGDFGPHTYTNPGPKHWVYMEYGSLFGDVEFTTSMGPCVLLPGGPGHTTFTVPPSTANRQTGGGWNAGHA